MYVFFSFSTTCLPFIRTSAKNIDLDQFVISIGRKTKKKEYVYTGRSAKIGNLEYFTYV